MTPAMVAREDLEESDGHDDRVWVREQPGAVAPQQEQLAEVCPSLPLHKDWIEGIVVGVVKEPPRERQGVEGHRAAHPRKGRGPSADLRPEPESRRGQDRRDRPAHLFRLERGPC